MKRNPSVKVELQTPSASNYVNGLYIKDGRLINDRAPGMSGIEQAANMKRIIKEDRKIEMISNGIERAESNKIMRDFFG
jgi:hypothetical protein|tara:strand:+ start:1165 stop:1401 length:237 start_codon:yes stop_codon:yes gene_type:complete